MALSYLCIKDKHSLYNPNGMSVIYQREVDECYKLFPLCQQNTVSKNSSDVYKVIEWHHGSIFQAKSNTFLF